MSYIEFIFEPTATDYGETGFYINVIPDLLVKEDLKLDSLSGIEAMFVRMILLDQKNLIIGYIYNLFPMTMS